MGFWKKKLCLLLILALLIPLAVPAQAASYKNTYVNTGDQRKDIIGVALTQIGYTEGPDNATKYGSWYQLNHEPWCAMFVSWCARQAGIPTSIIRNTAIACPNGTVNVQGKHFGVDYFDGEEYTPQPGDLFFTKNFSHVGLVSAVDGKYFYTVEGNSNVAGSDAGDRVVCNRRIIKDFYFGVPKYAEVTQPAPTAPTITPDKAEYRQGEHEVGDTIVFSWENRATDLERTLHIFKGDRIAEIPVTEDMTSYTIENAMQGGYLAVMSVKDENGQTAFSTCAVDVKRPFTLSLRYHTGEGSISPTPKYIVTADILVLRSAPYSSSNRVRLIPKDTVLEVTEVKAYWEELWGTTSYLDASGYIAIRDTTVARTGFFIDETGLVYAYPKEEPYTTDLEYRQACDNGLMSADSFGITRENYSFVGWSESPDGTGRIFRADDTGLDTLQLRPDFRYQDETMDLYAVWQKNVDTLTIATMPDKTAYYTGESLDTTGLSLDVTYIDGTQETVTEGFKVEGFRSATTGDCTLTVRFHDTTTSFTVSILNRLLFTQGEESVTIDGFVGASGELLLPATTAALPITAIAPEAFKDNKDLTGILIPGTVTSIGDNAFAGCDNLANVYFTGSQEQWDAIAMGSGNEALQTATVHIDYQIPGDYDGDRDVDEDDAIYLLQHVLFPQFFPVTTFSDLTGDGKTDEDDAIYLLQHVLFPEIYPL